MCVSKREKKGRGFQSSSNNSKKPLGLTSYTNQDSNPSGQESRLDELANLPHGGQQKRQEREGGQKENICRVSWWLQPARLRQD